jgi:hypothetical protein
MDEDPRYRWGAAGPAAYDCSGLVAAATEWPRRETYGSCEFCGAARDVYQTEIRWPAHMTLRELYCPACGRSAE